MSSTPELPELPDWLKSMGLPKVANEATDRYVKPIWDEIRSELELLPDHRGRLPEPASDGHGLTFEARALRARPPAGARDDSRAPGSGIPRAPVYSTAFASGFGTIYTAAYFPAEGRAEYRWPGFAWEQSFEEFAEGEPLLSGCVASRRLAMRGGNREESQAKTVTQLVPRRDVPRHLDV